jgi:hypothetical protein
VDSPEKAVRAAIVSEHQQRRQAMPTLNIGDRVQVSTKNLVRPLRGQTGTVIYVDAQQDVYEVKLDTPVATNPPSRATLSIIRLSRDELEKLP